jgi:hypothetical protein
MLHLYLSSYAYIYTYADIGKQVIFKFMPVPTHTSSMIHGGSSTGSLRFAERKSRATRISASDKTSNISPILRPRWIHMGNPWNPWNLGGTGAIWTSVFVIHIPGPQQ